MIPLSRRFLQFLDFLAELVDFGELDAEGHVGAGGADADGGVGIVQGVGQDGYTLEHEALEFKAGEFGGFLLLAGEFPAEIFVLEPAVEGFGA